MADFLLNYQFVVRHSSHSVVIGYQIDVQTRHIAESEESESDFKPKTIAEKCDTNRAQ